MRKLILLFLMLFPVVAQAQQVWPPPQPVEAPLWSASRLQVGTGLSYWFYDRGATQATTPAGFRKEFAVGIFGAYNLTKSLDAVVSTQYGLDNHDFLSSIGVRLVVFTGKPYAAPAQR